MRAQAKATLESLTTRVKSPETDYVFITFVLQNLPHGLIGLLIAAFFAATLSSKSAELNALASTTTIDFYRFLVDRQADDSHYVAASRWFTVLWGAVAVGFALFASLAENLIQAVNIVASIFYGVVLALFLVALFLRWVHGTAVFWAAVAAQLLVFVLFGTLNISYLWYNLIGCAACMAFSVVIQAALGSGGTRAEVPATDDPPTRHLLWTAALRLLPPALSLRQDRHGAAASGADRRRDRLFLSRQRPRFPRNPHHPAPPQDGRADPAQFRVREPGPAQVLAALPQAGSG